MIYSAIYICLLKKKKKKSQTKAACGPKTKEGMPVITVAETALITLLSFLIY